MQASGEWTGGGIPHCYLNLATILTLFNVAVALLTMLFALYLNRYLIKVLLFITLNISIDRKIDRQVCTYDTFVLYNTHADGNFVKFQLLDRLNNLNGSRFRAAYHEKHFVPGRDIFSNIEHIMTKSQTALVVLSPGFLTSKWAMYELSQAVVREHQGPHFKVIFPPTARGKDSRESS